LEELADTRPGFALQVTEVLSGAFVYIMHVLLLQPGGFRIHPGESKTNANMQVKEGIRSC
jgi:hypothetical protein